MTSLRILKVLLLILSISSLTVVHGQNLYSLLKNKRVYQTENIGDLSLSKIDGLLDDDIWQLGQWHGDFTQQQPYGGATGSKNTFICF